MPSYIKHPELLRRHQALSSLTNWAREKVTQNEFDELGKVYYDSFKVSRVHSGEISTRFLSDTTLNCGANYKRLTSHSSLLACSHGVLTWGRPTWNNHSISVFIVFVNKIEVRFSSVPLDLNQRSDSIRPPNPTSKRSLLIFFFLSAYSSWPSNMGATESPI